MSDEKVYSIKVDHEDGYSVIELSGDTPEDAEAAATTWAEEHQFQDFKVRSGPMRMR